MAQQGRAPSARETELLEAAYRYALEHGLADMSLRPLAREIGTSTRVLMYLFGSKDGLLRALLARARADELAMLADLQEPGDGTTDPADPATDLARVGARVWSWLCDERHRPLLRLWVEGYARSLVDPHGPWAGFAADTVRDWLAVLAAAQPVSERDDPAGEERRTLVLAVLRGALLDLLATGEVDRATAAVRRQLSAIATESPTATSSRG